MATPFDSLPGDLGKRAAAVAAQREAANLNVHFINERGEHNRVSLATPERVARFRAQLAREGREIIPTI